ncbi:ankyrin repeat domain-containing protein [Undibacterium flavidum]|uniref:Ankyrin repeat domain-containing protein n=1 Tax=Undibacterium flavidum TaxID=2762297 RepID=A0ABR6YGW6_9BURK|nr:ankyrin repeat domain-containing protein [Undibacterium flavidum]MBC3875830.1 ankyrin repeat domain-containing protein [Undibacterium flavidum]
MKPYTSYKKFLPSLLLIAGIFISMANFALAQTVSNEDKLLEAVRDGKTVVFKALLNSGANPQWRDKDGYDAFDYAIERHQFDISQLLLQHALDKTLNSEVDKRYVDAILNRQALTNQTTSTPIKIALLRLLANQGKTAEVMQLIQTGLPVDAGAETGYTALALAVRWQHKELLTQLLQAGADPNTHTNSCYQTTALMEASRDGNVDIAKQLISKGAKVNEPDKFGDHALNWAAFFGHLEFAQLLLTHGADLTRTGQTDDNALDVAIRQGHSKLVELLKNAGAKPHLKKSGNQ